MICLVLDQSIANRNANQCIVPILNSVLQAGNVSMSTPCLLIPYHSQNTSVYSKSTLGDSIQKIASLKYDHLNPMVNSLLDAMYLAYTSLKQSDSKHIIILCSTLYIDGFANPNPSKNISNMASMLDTLKSENISVSVLCKKGLKPIEELSKNGWRSSNPNYSVIFDKSFVPEIPHLTTSTNIPASVTFGNQQQSPPQHQVHQQTQQPIQQQIQQPMQQSIPNGMNMVPVDYYPPPPTDAALWSGQLQMNEIVAPVIATPISKHDVPQFNCQIWPHTLSIFGLYTVNIHTLQGYVQSNHIPIVSFEDQQPTPQFDSIKRSLQEQRKVAVIKQDQYHGFCIFMNNNRLLGLVMIKSQFPPDILQCLGYTSPAQQPMGMQMPISVSPPSVATPASVQHTPNQQAAISTTPQQLPQQPTPGQQQPQPIHHQQQIPQQPMGSPHLYGQQPQQAQQPMGSPQIRGGPIPQQFQQQYRNVPAPQQQHQYRNMPIYNPYMQQPPRGMQFRTPYGMMQYPMMMQPQMGMQQIPPQMMQQQQQISQPQRPQQPNMSPGMPQQMPMNNQQMPPNMQYMPQQYYQQGMQPQYRRPQ